ncbi:uncharacterized protein LOC116768186 [Danaus plexippus]|uniref:Uncharacterized protein n=1 Tax=Danaus plexippus plexippus TaxID=278856 RepID=A0A212F6I7_DANPL|nr:uncharacterized protein LOC116768186 [Danaus plexippus plexippus]XP_061379530.1 uncharacterized protein LOC116768186 [Danaus plexippus]OWR49343.1 hypothetical protein KGM_209552 [Danaus plexippus plexippus]
MDAGSVILGSLVLVQMSGILVLLNPIYDVRKVTRCMNNLIRKHRTFYFLGIAVYFICVVYLGMYIPLQNIHYLISQKNPNEYEKLNLLNRIEKNYLIAGFSLFLFVVLYGIRALISYASSLLEISVATSESIMMSQSSKTEKKGFFLPNNILPNLLRVKRSVSYETILFANELRDQLKMILRNVEFPHNSYAISNILETHIKRVCSS